MWRGCAGPSLVSCLRGTALNGNWFLLVGPGPIPERVFVEIPRTLTARAQDDNRNDFGAPIYGMTSSGREYFRRRGDDLF